MVKIWIALCLFVLVSAVRHKRQTQPCIDTWSLNAANNPCQRLGGLVYYPHPQDRRKFIQCGVFQRMYIVQCPAGMTYSQATTSCQNASTATSAPVTNPLNPCTQQHINNGQIYWPFPTDKSKFIECNANGVANVLSCPSGLLWDQTKVSCVYPAKSSGPVATIHPPHTGVNYCTRANINAGKMYFPHPDIHKFIQCDIAGNAYVNSCPSGLVWNVALETCYSPFNQPLPIG
ncbi:uncharacterized protein LOC121390392 [Gigantopelta aegis]|uniref:uncharacterized protein LOC121390392 n=1 Tax=Gigantopelta aegis TaxID=1735272 RepID=UPI001B88C761|nr:uncharacterized protein LOC121390392 [Gigantopelta aegis]